MNLANGIRKGRSSATLSPLTVIWFLSRFCLIVLMWYIIKGRPESERIGGNTGSTANRVLSDICLIETADGDGTLNNVSMKDGCLWHLNVRKCYWKAYLNRMQIYKKVRKRTNLQRKDECYGILCKSGQSQSASTILSHLFKVCLISLIIHSINTITRIQTGNLRLGDLLSFE